MAEENKENQWTLWHEPYGIGGMQGRSIYTRQHDGSMHVRMHRHCQLNYPHFEKNSKIFFFMELFI